MGSKSQPVPLTFAVGVRSGAPYALMATPNGPATVANADTMANPITTTSLLGAFIQNAIDLWRVADISDGRLAISM